MTVEPWWRAARRQLAAAQATAGQLRGGGISVFTATTLSSSHVHFTAAARPCTLPTPWSVPQTPTHRSPLPPSRPSILCRGARPAPPQHTKKTSEILTYTKLRGRAKKDSTLACLPFPLSLTLTLTTVLLADTRHSDEGSGGTRR